MQYRLTILLAAWLTGIVNGQTLVDLRTQSKSVNFSGANSTQPFQSGAVLPAVCVVDQAFFQTNAPAGLNLYGCTAVNSWTLLSAGILLGDVTGTPGVNTVTKIQGRAVSAAAPTSGESLVWNSTTNSWTPQTITGTIAHIQNAGTNLPVEAVAQLHGRRVHRRSNQQPHRLQRSGGHIRIDHRPERDHARHPAGPQFHLRNRDRRSPASTMREHLAWIALPPSTRP